MKKENLFKTKRFLPLFITQFLGAFNDNAFKNAFLIWFTFDIVSNENNLYFSAEIMLSLAGGLFILPFFLLSTLAGQIADKFEKSYLTQKIKFAEIILMCLSFLCFYFSSVYGLLLVLFLMGVQSTFFGPIKYSLLPEFLREDELIQGNAWIEAGTFLSILLGTIFGGIVVRINYGIEIINIFLIFCAVTGYFSSFKIPRSRVCDEKSKISLNFVKETREIMKFSQENKEVWYSILAISWFWLIGSVFLSQFPVFTKEIIGANEQIVTLFLTLFSLGIGIGSLLCNKIQKGEINGKFVPYASFGISLSIIVFVFSSYLFQSERLEYIEILGLNQDILLSFSAFFLIGISAYCILASLLLLSIIAGIYIVPLYAIMQHCSKLSHVSRVIAVNNIINSLFMVFISIVMMILFSLNFDLLTIFIILAIANLIVSFNLLKFFTKESNNV